MLALDFQSENEITEAAKEKGVGNGINVLINAIADTLTEEGEAFKAFCDIILKQTGLTRLLWGKVLESEAKLILLLGE